MARPSRLLLLPVFLLFTLPAYAIDEPFLTACSDEKFSSQSKYHSNLHLFLSQLIDSVPTSPNFFSMAYLGNPLLPNSLVSLSAGPMPLPDIAQSASVSPPPKPPSTSPAFAKFFGIIDNSVMFVARNVENSSNPVVFKDELQRLMAVILPKASSSQSRFAVGKRMMEEQQNIYGLAWCSMDLTITDCLNCLSSVQDWLLTWKIGGRTAYSSCYIRFEVYDFLSLEVMSGTPRGPQTVPNVWRYWKEGWADRIIDDSLCGQYPSQEVLECMHIGLLCVQDNKDARPSIASLMMMFGSSSMTLPMPSTPAFYDGESIFRRGLSGGKVNQLDGGSVDEFGKIDHPSCASYS
ncbi:hypothetical protein HPP92_014108 [Vanilla planifolia]|uniref:Gnk2-homologous domain-containing protein n=1 Tax=Vanilla planifolia TaxID=51239 RepID=A0A835R0P0_VANPL|nr:hypothetical protein HPP92_014108 [Vanilla planifolia]